MNDINKNISKQKNWRTALKFQPYQWKWAVGSINKYLINELINHTLECYFKWTPLQAYLLIQSSLTIRMK